MNKVMLRVSWSSHEEILITLVNFNYFHIWYNIESNDFSYMNKSFEIYKMTDLRTLSEEQLFQFELVNESGVSSDVLVTVQKNARRLMSRFDKVKDMTLEY